MTGTLIKLNLSGNTEPQVTRTLGIIGKPPIRLMESSNLNMTHHKDNHFSAMMTRSALQTNGKEK